MNRILSFGLAAVATVLLSQPVYAKKDGGGGGRGGGRGGGGKAHFSAPAKHFSVAKNMRAPSKSMRAPSMPKIAKQSRPQFKGPAMVAKTRPKMPVATMARGSAIAQQKGRAPSIAFGGTKRENSGTLAFQPPTEVSRSWDHSRIQNWNNHHYRWSDGNWVVLDGGFYGLPYDGGQPYFNYYPNPGYATTPPAGSLIANVQNALLQLGYNPGPPDGVIGPQTQDAIASFQSDRHLPVTGQVDPSTLQALGM